MKDPDANQPSAEELAAVKGMVSTGQGILASFVSILCHANYNKAVATARASVARATSSGSAPTGGATGSEEPGPRPTLAAAATELVQQIAQETPQIHVDVITSPKELKRISMKGMVHRFNVEDPWQAMQKVLRDLRVHRQKWLSDAEYADAHGAKQMNGILKGKKMAWPWKPSAMTSRALDNLPQGHQWEPDGKEVALIVAASIFEVRNPESGATNVSGSDAPNEFNLRKCIVYDFVEGRDGLEATQILNAWKSGVTSPAEPSQQPPPSTVRYTRPTIDLGSGTPRRPFDTYAAHAIEIKRAAATATLDLLQSLSNTAA